VSYVVSLEGFIPGARYDGQPWTSARIDEGPSTSGPWTSLGVYALTPLDPDPANPGERNFTTTSPNPRGWYRVTWIDAAAAEQDTPPIWSDQTQSQVAGVPFRDLVGRLRALSALSQAEAEARINQAHRRWVADCEALKVGLEIGATVTGQDTYLLEQRVVSLRNLRVDGRRYERRSVDEVEDLKASDAYTVGAGNGFFAQNFTEGGLYELLLWPAPAQDGLAITGRASVLPQDLVADLDFPDLPADFHEDLIDDALATTLRRDDERLADAQALDAQTAQRKRELSGRLTHRVGRGVARVRLTR
jgi:hypothetical protein